jgi:diaminopropionate ammonia-lyase
LTSRPAGAPPAERLVAATDGNHGRAVAHVAALWGLKATILVPVGTAPARIEAIAGEGADVVVVDGTYDEAVARSAELADDVTLVVSDTSWPGYEDLPRWVIEGYSTIFAELGGQLAGPPDVAFVPIGVGALAAAAATGLRGSTLVGVEPDTAACVLAAVEAGELVEVPGPHRSIMAGLNCGFASAVALPTVTAAFPAFVTVDDDTCRRAIRLLAAAGLEVGETGAAALAGLLTVSEVAPDLLPAGGTVLLLATEGVTDPAGFEAVVGRPPS